MIEHLFQLIVLFFVIFDPPLSYSVFLSATSRMNERQKKNIALIAISVAWSLSLLFLIFGVLILETFSTNLNDFRVAGGLILLLLGIKMVLGHSTENKFNEKSSQAIASIIATPLLTGPAAITAIILNSADYGMLSTGMAFSIVLGITGLLFYYSRNFSKYMNPSFINILSTLLGMITISWGVMFIRAGLGI